MNLTHPQTPDCWTKSHMNFQYELQMDGFEFPKACDSQIILLSQSSGDNFTPIIEQDDSLRSIVDPFLSSGEESLSSSGNHSKFPCQNQNMPVYQNSPQQHNKLMVEDATISTQKNQPYCSSVHRESSTTKKRMRWNEDLHEQFIIIVNSLGGPQKAKPKAILEKMDSDLLTISHIKSHLQILKEERISQTNSSSKYRTTAHMQKALQEGFVEGHGRDGVAELQAKIHKQIEESQQLQLDVQRSLDQQLEIQRNLEVIIEQQKRHAMYQV